MLFCVTSAMATMLLNRWCPANRIAPRLILRRIHHRRARKMSERPTAKSVTQGVARGEAEAVPSDPSIHR